MNEIKPWNLPPVGQYIPSLTSLQFFFSLSFLRDEVNLMPIVTHILLGKIT